MGKRTRLNKDIQEDEILEETQDMGVELGLSNSMAVDDGNKAPNVVTATPAKRPAVRVTFDNYVICKGIRAAHIPGMRAFIPNPGAIKTVDEWDELFKTY